MAEQFSGQPRITNNRNEEQERPSFIQEFDLGKLLFTFRKSLPAIFLIMAFCAAGVFLYLRYSKLVFQASAIIQLKFKSTPSLIGLELASGFNEGIDAVNLARERELIMSRLIYNQIIDSLNLEMTCHIKGEVLSDERYPSRSFELIYEQIPDDYLDKHFLIEVLDEREFLLSVSGDLKGRYKFNETVQLPNFTFQVVKGRGYRPEERGDFYITVHSHNALYRYLRKNLSVNTLSANRLQISFNENNREKAMDIVEAITNTYERISISNKNQVFVQTLGYLDEIVQTSRDSLDKYERKLFEYRKANLTQPRQTDFQGVFAQVKSLEGQRLQLDQKLVAYDLITNALFAESSMIYVKVIAPLAQNPEITQLINQMNALEIEMERILASYKETTAAVQQRQMEIDRVRSSLFLLMNYDQAQIRDRIREINSKMYELENGVYEYQSEDPALRKINRSRDIYGNIVSQLSNKIIEMNIAKAGTVPDFRILSPSSASTTPIAPVPTMIYLVGGGAGVAISIFLVLLRYLLQNRINGLKEVSRLAKVPLIGVIPKYDKRSMDYSQLVANINPKSSISEALRSIRTNLDFLNTEKKERIISVTSTISGEGKTFVAINIAGIIAMSRSRVVVLDLDLRKPKIHLAFGVENTLGISSMLVGKSDLEECLNDSSIESLKFITAGPLPPNPSELIMSDAFDKLLKQLQESFDVIVFDTPPVGLVTDGVIAMRKATFPIYVLRANYSRLHFIYNVNNLARSNRFDNLSIVLNSVDHKNTYGYGGYGYGYGYGYGGYGYGYVSNGYGYYEEDKPAPIWKRVFNRKR